MEWSFLFETPFFLVCFPPSLFRSVVKYLPFMPAIFKHSFFYLINQGIEEHKGLAVELMSTCYQFYSKMETGLSPEIMTVNPLDGKTDLTVESGANFNLLRPGTYFCPFFCLLYQFRTQDQSFFLLSFSPIYFINSSLFLGYFNQFCYFFPSFSFFLMFFIIK